MPDLRALHDAATFYLIGLIWLVQVVHYPMFQYLDRAGCKRAHAFHSNAITILVMPAMLLELALAGLFAWRTPDVPSILGFALVLLIWAMTFLVMVPLHQRFGAEGFDAKVHAKLVHWNWVRTIAWTTRGILILWWLPRS